jgi:hypothetical protein
MPNGDRAVVPIEKLMQYVLDPAHPAGRHKSRVFARALGITRESAEILEEALLKAAADGESAIGELDRHGQRYVIDFEMTTDVGTAMVRSAWIIRTNEEEPRLVTCHVV